MNKNRDKVGLFSESRLFDIYLIALRTGPNRFNITITAVVAVASLVYACAEKTDINTVLDIARTSASDGLAFSSSILGFLIAGFAIFLTPTRPELFVRMQESVHKKTGYTYLKYNLSGFVVVFIHYFLFAAVCFILKSFGSVHGPFSVALQELPSAWGQQVHDKIRSIGIVTFFVGVESWFFYLLMLMKSFIFNLYHIVMTMVAFEIEDRRKQAAEKIKPPSLRKCRRQR